MTRSICYGLCPAYGLDIFGDGLVVYTGRAHVRVRGRHSKNIGSVAASGLVTEFLTSGFPGWKNKYETGGPDMAGAEISLTVGATRKTIVDCGTDYPRGYGDEMEVRSKLEALEHRIDQVAESAEWVTCPDEEEGRCHTF